MKKTTTSTVLFNASVILAGLNSPSGGSGKLLTFSKQGKIIGVASEVIADEVLRHTARLNLDNQEVVDKLPQIFSEIYPPPEQSLVETFKGIVTDVGDAHVLASCFENKAEFLVSLDKKHLLVLKDQIKMFKIVSPGELIKILKTA